MGLEYKGPHPDTSFQKEPTSSRQEKDHFKPEQVQLKEDGTARFKIWSEDSDSTATVKLNGAQSPPIGFLPAVFEDRFHVTVYYTVLESKCSGAATSEITAHIGSPEGKTVSLKKLNNQFLKALRLEGFGRLVNAYIDASGKTYPYLGYMKIDKNDVYYLSEKILGRYSNELDPKKSCAGDPKIFNISSKRHSKIKIILEDKAVSDFEGNEFVLSDVGGGIKDVDIDLYWGEDGPSPNDSTTPQGLSRSLQGNPYTVILLQE